MKTKKPFQRIAALAVLVIFGAMLPLAVSATGTPVTDWYVNSPSTETNFTITTADELAGLAVLVNGGVTFAGKKITLAADIDLSVYGAGLTFNDGKGWKPIGTDSSNTFRGIFDGGGYVITALEINDTGSSRLGLFGHISGGTVKNLGISGVNINGDTNIGGLVGMLRDDSTGLFINGKIENCYVTGTVNGIYQVGGIAGTATDSNITDCYTSGTVNGMNGVGGVVGMFSAYNMENCYSTAAVSGTDGVGGVVGTLSYESVTNCAALNISVEITGATTVGRVVGSNSIWNPGTLSDNVAFDGITGIAGSTAWGNKGETEKDGADITTAQILADGTLDGRFTAPAWLTENGKLPILAGFESSSVPQSNALPAHLIPLTGTAKIDNTAPKVGNTLTATLENANHIGTLNFQWKAAGANVGTNSNTYEVQLADVNKPITVEITSTFESGTRTSDPTAPVAEPVPATGMPDITAKTTATFVLFAISAVLWGFVIRRKFHATNN